jgi:P pilus assembly chaperone PapD
MPRKFSFGFLTGGALALLTLATPAIGAGDLLVAPTRLELDGFRGTEVVLNNIGSETATYRISLELRRMTADGRLEDVTQPTAAEQAALDLISYAPRRVTLEPNQPQAIRVGVRPPEGLAEGEYRVHMLFRAIPDAKAPAAPEAPAQGVSVQLTPIYGVTIPVIVRNGKLAAQAGIANARIVEEGGRQAVSFDLTRSGNRSLYGEVRVLKPGMGDPVVSARGIAIYHEIDSRNVTLPVAEGFTGSLAGPATIQYLERNPNGSRVLAESQVVLR